MSNLDPQTNYQPYSEKLTQLLPVSDDLVTLVSGTSDAALLALVVNKATIGVTLPTGIATGLSATGTATDHISLAGTYSNAIKIGGVSGVGLYINKTANTAAAIKSHCHMLAADGVDAPNFVANEFKGEFLSTGTDHATMDGIAAHFHLSASSTGILRSILGVAYLDSGKTLSGTDYTNSGWLNAGTFVADVSGVINGTGVVVNGVYAGIGSCQLGTLTACKYLTSLFVTSNRLTALSAGQSSLILATNPAGTSKVAVDGGLIFEAGTDLMKQIIIAGTSSVPIVNSVADTKFIQIYSSCSATSGDNRGIYNRLYLTSTGGGESLRSYTDVSGTVGTAHGAHISLGFGESNTTGAVTGLGAGLRVTLGLANIAYPATGTLGVIDAEIYSFGTNSDPSGNQVAIIRAGNNGNSGGQADVDDDALLLALDGWTSGTGKMMVKAATPGAIGNATYSLRCKMADGALAYLNLTAAPVTA